MANPIYQSFGNPQRNIISEFNRFRASFRGDPKQEVQRLLQSGQMTQEQLNELQGQAQQFMQMLGR